MAKLAKVMTKEDEKWKIESDASILERYMELVEDEERLGKAEKYLEEKKERITGAIKLAKLRK